MELTEQDKKDIKKKVGEKFSMMINIKPSHLRQLKTAEINRLEKLVKSDALKIEDI